MPPVVEPLVPPADGVTVRMYRQGHGDCFLIAFPREGGGKPYYVMIDCGYKPGSEAFLDHGMPIGDIVQHLHSSCGGRLDLVILTHEHQDHLNGLWRAKNPYFADFEVERAWLAWTENPKNDLANELRKRYKDQLLGLLAARRELALADDGKLAVSRIDSLLGLELGSDPATLDNAEMLAAGEDPARSVNKQGMKLIKDKATTKQGVSFRKPGEGPLPLEGTAGVRAFVFGPPESAELIADEDPRDGEGFPQDHPFSFAGAFRAPPNERSSPFRRHYFAPLEHAFEPDIKTPFFREHYGRDDGAVAVDTNLVEVPADAPWRRIDNEWLFSAETLALKLNTGINNTSLVVAFELPKSRKVLFFAADAQRGNWVSWKDVTFTDGGKTVTTKDILSRAVLYKVGHHGSHNATLAGTVTDAHPNLEWMGQGDAASEFTAMITAVNKWALTKNNPPWVHPLPSIRAALESKAQGRVFQTDQNTPEQPTDVTDGEWKKFTDRSVFADEYFDWTVLDA